MNSRDWTEILVSAFLTLLTEFMRKHGYDAAQEVISRTSADLAFHDPVQLSLDGSESFRSAEKPMKLSYSEEKDLFRQLNGTS